VCPPGGHACLHPAPSRLNCQLSLPRGCREGDEAWQQSQQASAALAAQLHIPQTAVQAAVSLHNQLFSQGDYYSALTGLSRHDAVRMEAARFFAFFPVDREHRCECGCGGGRGDMLRMAAGVVCGPFPSSRG
jgi:hypothetical protein